MLIIFKFLEKLIELAIFYINKPESLGTENILNELSINKSQVDFVI